jgi:hypothetical protein
MSIDGYRRLGIVGFICDNEPDANGSPAIGEIFRQDASGGLGGIAKRIFQTLDATHGVPMNPIMVLEVRE